MIERSSGILMPISSLPSPHGIGTMGKAAYDFADFLAAAGQKYWQLLPLGPTSYGDSPYQSFSSFAGNPYFIDLDLLVKDKLLTRAEVNACDWGDDPRYVDYGKIYASRFTLLEKAKTRGFTRDREAVAAFERENERWLPNYALFMALKRHFGMKSWTEWDDEDIRCRTSSEVIERYRAELREDVELFTYIQFLFFRQWEALKAYIHSLGIRIIGEVTAEKVRIVQDADYIYREEIAKAGLDRSIGQYFAALTNMRSVGVMGDERTYDYAVALRAVKTIDFMTAESADIPFEVLQTVMTRIINEVKGVNRVFYDLTSKPPGTIEFE